MTDHTTEKWVAIGEITCAMLICVTFICTDYIYTTSRNIIRL